SYTNKVASLYWTNTTAWSVAGQYPGSQGGTEIAVITNASDTSINTVVVDANNPVISDLICSSPDGSTVLIFSNAVGQTLTVTDRVVLGTSANPAPIKLTGAGTLAITNATGTAQLLVGVNDGTLTFGRNFGTLIADQIYSTNNNNTHFIFGNLNY